MSRTRATERATSPTVVALTGRQRLALALDKGGMGHAEIARQMGLRHRETATRLVARARKAEKAFVAALAEFVGTP